MQGWQAVPEMAAPAEVSAARSRGTEPGFGVGKAAFASPGTGWAYAGNLETAQCRVLYTDDAGATWAPQLAWHGLSYRGLVAFDERRAAVGLSVSQGKDINGYRPPPRAPGDPFIGPELFLASTVDGGTTWTLAPVPGSQVAGLHFLAPRQMWVTLRVSGLVRAPDGSFRRREGGDRADLMRTTDGGITWQRARGMDGVGAMSVRFRSVAEGLLVAAGERGRIDLLYQTADGGLSWERVPLEPPPGLPASAGTVLEPVAGRDGRVLLVLSARSWSEAERRPRWEGTYVYHGDGQGGWAGPYRLPLAAARHGPPHVAVPGPDGRTWAAAGQDLFVADDLAGPWRPRTAALPPGQVITGLDPVGGGVLWLTTRAFPAVVAVSGGQLHRSADDGAHWARVCVTTPA
jgi:hypothetical protein